MGDKSKKLTFDERMQLLYDKGDRFYEDTPVTGATAATNNADNDPHVNWQEYVADTDPTNPASYFHIDALSNTVGRTLYCLSSSSRLYTLEGRTNLQQGSCRPIAGQSNIWGNGGRMPLTDSRAAATSGFYRVRVQLP